MNLASTAFIVPAVLGALIVVQAGLNRRIGMQWGLPTAVFLNGVVLTVGAALLLLYFWFRPASGLNEIRLDFRAFAPWFVVPGLIGLGLVFGGPWSIAQIGAPATFVIIVASQLAMSLCWDIVVDGGSISPTRLAGVALAWIGVLLASLK